MTCAHLPPHCALQVTEPMPSFPVKRVDVIPSAASGEEPTRDCVLPPRLDTQGSSADSSSSSPSMRKPPPLPHLIGHTVATCARAPPTLALPGIEPGTGQDSRDESPSMSYAIPAPVGAIEVQDAPLPSHNARLPPLAGARPPVSSRRTAL